MDDGLGGNFVKVFTTINSSPSIVEYLATGLNTALPYRIKVVAYNYNGAGLESNIATYYPCKAPSNW